MKNSKALFDRLGDLPDDLILEADPANFTPRKQPVPWIKIISGGLAAALVLALAWTLIPRENASGGTQTEDPPSGNVISSAVSEDPKNDSPELPQISLVLGPNAVFDMFSRIPRRAWFGARLADWKVGYGRDVDSKVVDLMFERGILDPDTPAYAGDYNNASYPRIPHETVEALYLEVWGPIFMSRYDGTEYENKAVPWFITNQKAQLSYEESTDSYVFYNYPFERYPDPSGDHFYARFLRMEMEGEELQVYVLFANYDVEKGEYSVYGEQGGWWENDKYHSVLLRGYDSKAYQTDPDSVFSRLHAGMFDDYLPIYRVTFKADENGTYWWSYSRQVQAGTSIPEELLTAPIPEEDPTKGPVLPVYGEKDTPSGSEGEEYSYFMDEKFWFTVDGLLYAYAPIPGHGEQVTPTEKIESFTQTQKEQEVTWEVYAVKEHPDYSALYLVCNRTGESAVYYQLN